MRCAVFGIRVTRARSAIVAVREPAVERPCGARRNYQHQENRQDPRHRLHRSPLQGRRMSSPTASDSSNGAVDESQSSRHGNCGDSSRDRGRTTAESSRDRATTDQRREVCIGKTALFLEHGVFLTAPRRDWSSVRRYSSSYYRPSVVSDSDASSARLVRNKGKPDNASEVAWRAPRLDFRCLPEGTAS